MKKEIVYIDVEDDITAIIDKVKSSSGDVVSFVLPKRVGVLRSLVNLKLLKLSADKFKKKIVLITNNKSLIDLASSAGILTAKTLQSKPELGEIPALSIKDEDEDVIDGSDMPLAILGTKKPKSSLDKDIESMNKEGKIDLGKTPDNKEDDDKQKKKSVVLPDFKKTRKKIFIFGSVAVFLILFLVWALVFAPSAKIIITAKTSSLDYESRVILSSENNFNKNNLKVRIEKIEKPLSAVVEATGEKDVSETAKGTVVFSTRDIDLLGKTIPAGTRLISRNGLGYVTSAPATFSLSNYRGVTVSIQAESPGAKYNGDSGPLKNDVSGSVSVRFETSPSGGTDKKIKVVTQGDVNKASEGLLDKDSQKIKDELKSRFSDDYMVIEQSFDSIGSDPEIKPAVGEEAKDGKADLKTVATYQIEAVKKTDLNTFLEGSITNEIKKQGDKKVYDTGFRKATISDFNKNDSQQTVILKSSARVGIVIDKEKVKKESFGKKYGDVKKIVSRSGGVESLDIKFSPFWVNTVPNSPSRVKVEFRVVN